MGCEDLRVDGEAEAAAAGDVGDLLGHLHAGADRVVGDLVAHGGEEHRERALADPGDPHDEAVRLALPRAVLKTR